MEMSFEGYFQHISLVDDNYELLFKMKLKSFEIIYQSDKNELVENYLSEQIDKNTSIFKVIETDNPSKTMTIDLYSDHLTITSHKLSSKLMTIYDEVKNLPDQKKIFLSIEFNEEQSTQFGTRKIDGRMNFWLVSKKHTMFF